MGDGVAGVEGLDGTSHGLHFAEFGGDGKGFLGLVDEGEVPLAGDAGVQTEQLPAGDGDVADEAGGDEVYGLVDGDEFVEELIVLAAIFVAEGDVVGRGEMFEFFGAKAVFDGVTGGFLLPFRSDRAFALRSVFAGYFGALFFGHTASFLGLEMEKALVLARAFFGAKFFGLTLS